MRVQTELTPRWCPESWTTGWRGAALPGLVWRVEKQFFSSKYFWGRICIHATGTYTRSHKFLTLKKTIDQLAIIKIKNFCSSEDCTKKMKMQTLSERRQSEERHPTEDSYPEQLRNALKSVREEQTAWFFFFSWAERKNTFFIKEESKWPINLSKGK